MNKLAFSGLLAITLLAIPNKNAEAVCLDYWLKGPAACKEEEENKNKIKIDATISGEVVKDEARLRYEEELDKEIDKFLAGYGKPPREFAAFHLDPTLENAVRWVKKFNEEHERTMKVAVAWKQADFLFRQYKETGEITLPANSGVKPEQIKYLKQAFEEKGSDLPEVKGFGIDLPGHWDEDRLSRNYSELKYKERSDREVEKILEQGNPVSVYGLEALEKQISESDNMSDAVEKLKKAEESRAKNNSFLGAITGTNKNIEKPNEKATTKSSKQGSGKEKLEISYYFSAKCPFCQQFKPELEDAIAQYGKSNVKLTCVDMTPGEKKPSNKGSLDCKWRPVLTGEQQQFGVAKTPTILVKRGESNQLELLENYHDSDTLIDYFTNGARM